MALTVTDRPIGYAGYFEHGWSCAHLPIAYKMESDLYPVNTVDAIGIVGGIGGSNGYTQLNFSPSLSLVELDFVTVRHDPNGGSNYINEPFQILEILSSSSIIINLAWPNSFSFYSVQSYKSNYHAVVNVYAGLNASHHFASEKPYELAATLRFIPDSDNEIHFSINEILKSYIDIRNNTAQTTLPNDLESFTQFYISYYESYDQSNGYTIGTHNGSTTVDTEEGYAVNSILEFKNQYSGFMSDYLVDTSLTSSKFLTLFENPTIFSGNYFDISFITSFDGPITLVKNWVDANGNTITTSTETVQDYSQGLYRIPLSIDQACDLNMLAVQLISNTYLTTTLTLPALSTFTNVNVPSGGNNWLSGNHLTLNGAADETSKSFTLLYSFIAGYTYTITYTVSSSAAWISTGMTLRIFDSSNTVLSTQSYSSISGTAGSSVIKTHTFVAPSGAVKYAISVNRPPAATGTSDYQVLSITATGTQNFISTIALTEIKYLNINCACSSQSIYLTWLNNLGAYEYWNFTAFSEYGTDVGDTGETKTNIFPNWPTSYGSSASEIRKQTFRESSKRIVVSSQHLTLEEKLAIEYIRSSIVVEIMYSQYDKRRVIVDKDSFISYKDNDKLYTVSFSISYTDNIPSQRL